MAEITAKMVADLRAATGLGMMECKKALVEAEGNFEKAEEILRIKSGAKAGKLAGRTAAEGVLAYAINGNVGALVEVNCETDFVAKDAGFVEFANFVAKTAAEKKPATVEELSELVEAERKAIIAKLGENMSVRRFQVIDTANQLVAYIHGALATEGVLVGCWFLRLIQSRRRFTQLVRAPLDCWVLCARQRFSSALSSTVLMSQLMLRPMQRIEKF